MSIYSYNALSNFARIPIWLQLVRCVCVCIFVFGIFLIGFFVRLRAMPLSGAGLVVNIAPDAVFTSPARSFDIDVSIPSEVISIDLFKPLVRDIKPQKVSVQSDIPVSEEIGLQVIGVVLGAHNNVVIEDTVHNKTYFLGVGDRIDHYVIENISEGKVVIHDGDTNSVLTF